MRKVINGRLYDTDKAHRVGEWDNGRFPTDFDYEQETLYRKKTGEYFIHGEGGARSVYAQERGSDGWRGGERIMPCSYDRARKWVESNLTADEYEAEFGLPDEDEGQVQLSCKVSAKAMALIRRTAQREGTSIAAVVERLALALEEA